MSEIEKGDENWEDVEFNGLIIIKTVLKLLIDTDSAKVLLELYSIMPFNFSFLIRK